MERNEFKKHINGIIEKLKERLSCVCKIKTSYLRDNGVTIKIELENFFQYCIFITEDNIYTNINKFGYENLYFCIASDILYEFRTELFNHVFKNK